MPEQFPKESIDGDAHTLTTDGRRYDVYKLIEHSKDVAPVAVSVESLRSQVLEEKCWDDLHDVHFSPRELLNEFESRGSWEAVEQAHPEWIKHIEKTKRADLSFPILMLKDDVIDGMHRLIRACVEKKSEIVARQLQTLPDETIYIPKS